LWCLYNFANSFVFINFLVYFSKWLVVDGGIPDLAYNSVFILTAGLLLFSAPALAARTDESGGRMRYLNAATIGTNAAYAAAAGAAILGANPWLALAFFIIGQFCYQMSFVFLDPLITDLADESHRARASGLAQFFSSFGMILGLGLSLPLVANFGRLSPLLPSIAIFVLLSLPVMLNYKEKPVGRPATKTRIRLGFDWKKFKNFVLTSAAAPILIAFFFYNDALATITNNYSIYAGKVLGMSDAMTSIILIVVQVAGAIGALLTGWLGDKFGVRRTMKVILCCWLALIPVMALAHSQPLFFVLAGLLGMTIGAGWTVSRADISNNLEDGGIGYGFSFYTIFEKFSAMMGPLLWGGILAAGFGYRAAMMSMAGFVLIGLIILCRKPLPRR